MKEFFASYKIETIWIKSYKLTWPHPKCKITAIEWWEESLIKGLCLKFTGKRALNMLTRTITKLYNIRSGIPGSDAHHEYIIIYYEPPQDLSE